MPMLSRELLFHFGHSIFRSDLEAYATGFHLWLSDCNNTAAASNPKDEASADTLVSARGLYSANTPWCAGMVVVPRKTEAVLSVHELAEK